MKGISFKILLTFVLAIFIVTPAVAAQISVDGNNLNVQTTVENGVTLIPLRTIFQTLGATVDWDNDTRTVIATKDQTTIKITIGSKIAYVNNGQVELQVPGQIIDGKTMVPLRFVSESLGANVSWNDTSKTVSISTNTAEEPKDIKDFTESEVNNDTQIIYDDFSMPLSNNWDVSDAGNWTIEPGKGAVCYWGGAGCRMLYLPLLNKYKIPDEFTIEIELCINDDGYTHAGVYLGEKMRGPTIYASLIHLNKNGMGNLYAKRGGMYNFPKQYIELGRTYKMKVVKKSNNSIDVYFDGKYAFSGQMADDIEMSELGIYSHNGHIKSFKLIPYIQDANSNSREDNFNQLAELFNISSIQYEKNQIPKINYENESIAIDSFYAKRMNSGWEVNMNVFNKISGFELSGSHAVIAIYDSKGNLQDAQVVPGWRQPPSMFKSALDSIFKLKDAWSDPYSVLDDRDAMNSTVKEIKNLYVKGGYKIVISKSDGLAIVYNAYTMLGELLGLAGINEITSEDDFMKEFKEIMLDKEYTLKQLLKQDKYLEVANIIIESGLEALEKTIGEQLYKELTSKILKSKAFKSYTGTISLAENLVLASDLAQQMKDLAKHLTNPKYMDNTVVLLVPSK